MKVFTAENNELGVIKRGDYSSFVSLSSTVVDNIPPASNISQLAKLVRAVVKAASLRMQPACSATSSNRHLLPPSANLVANALCGITEFLFALSARTAHATCTPSSPSIVHLGVPLHGSRRDSRRYSCFESTPTINSNRRRVGSLSSRVLSQVVELPKPQIAPTRERKRERARHGTREKTLESLFRLRFAKFKRYSRRALNHTQVRICVISVIIQPLETGRCEVHNDYNRSRHNRGVIVIN